MDWTWIVMFIVGFLLAHYILMPTTAAGDVKRVAS